uniref:Acid ceramidase n=1 Tax=Romanomermis culicivorax TaxID=13658 RepID=A0A915KRP5_ROMCU
TKSPPEPFNDRCLIGERGLYPGPQAQVPKFVIDLDQPPSIRWNEVARNFSKKIKDLSDVLSNKIIEPVLGKKIWRFLDWTLGDLDARFPAPYADELKGNLVSELRAIMDIFTQSIDSEDDFIEENNSTHQQRFIRISNATGVPLGQIVLYNIFYEIFTVCTSIVAQDESGGIYHARNMDFGLLIGWNRTSHDWLVTEKLRKMVLNVDFHKNGKLLFRAATFAGYVGVYNAMRPNSYAVTVNERFKMDGGYRGIVQWLLKRNNDSWMSWMVRDVFERVPDYETAVEKLSSIRVIAPLYVIISGTKSGQGRIIVRSRQKTDGFVDLDDTKRDGWFILETNTDPWSEPTFFDDRRTPGRNCMQKLSRKNLTLPGLFQVLSSPTNLNKLTVFSILIKTDQDRFETYVQKCPDPCWPW